jgi:hypothetical protein
MSCPLLRRTQQPQCRAIAGEPLPLPRHVVAVYCRGNHASCPAFRYLRASGHPVHAADFESWVLRDIPPGRSDAPEATAGSDRS